MSIKKTYIPAKPRSSKLVGTSMSGGVAGSVSSSSADPNAHSHSNKVVLDKLTDGDIDVLGKLSVDEDGNIKVDTTLWATGGISALGLGDSTEPGTGSDFDRLDAWVDYNETKANWVLSALLGYDLHTRINSLEAGGGASNIEIAITGSGNAVTGVSKDGNTLTFAKGSTFSLSTHNHDTIYKPIGYVPSWSEITNKPATFAPSAHTHTIANVTGLQTALDAKEASFAKNTAFNKNFGTVEGTVMQGNDSRIHSHSNKALLDLISQSNIDVLNLLSVVEGNIKVDTTLWATGGVSALGLGEDGGSSGGGGVDMLDSWANYALAKANFYVPASLLVSFRNDTLSRLTSLESGSATSIVTTGAGNAVTSLTKSDNVITANKGLTFALATHSHTIAQITGLQGALNLKASQSDIDTAINGIEIGGRNLVLDSKNIPEFLESRPYTTIGSVTADDSVDEHPDGWMFLITGKGEPANRLRAIIRHFLPPNTQYTLSITVKENRGITLEVDALLGNEVIIVGPYETKRVILTTMSDNGGQLQIRFLTSLVDINAAYIDISLWGLKIEKGNKATDWAPAPEDQVSDWSTTDVTSFSFIKNKPTQLSQFTDNIGVGTHIANKANPHAVTTAQIGAVNLTTNQSIGGKKTFNTGVKVSQTGYQDFLVFERGASLWSFGMPGSNLVISNGDITDQSNRLITIGNNGNIRIGDYIANPLYKLDVTGTGRFTSGLIAPKVDFGNGFTIEPSGTELVFKYNGVIKQRMLSDGTILATYGITALATN